jgi:hypothetical protein
MVSEIDPIGSLPPSLLEPALLTPRDLATAVDQHLAALWRGDESVDDPFFRWLASCWTSNASPEPATPPQAVSILGAGGGGIRWYEMGSEFIGYAEGRPGGCYHVPNAAALPPTGRSRPTDNPPR